LDRGDVVAVPDRLEHGVREPQIDDLVDAHLPEVVVDPVELILADRLVQLVRERAGGLEVVTERLLNDDARVRRQARGREPLHDSAEEEGWDLEVEDREGGAFDRLCDPSVRRVVPEVPGDVREPRRKALEHLLVQFLAGADDRLPRALDELVDRPIVDCDAENRAVQKPALLEPVEGMERHDLRQVACDAEDHETVGPAGVRHDSSSNCSTEISSRPSSSMRSMKPCSWAWSITWLVKTVLPLVRSMSKPLKR